MNIVDDVIRNGERDRSSDSVGSFFSDEFGSTGFSIDVDVCIRECSLVRDVGCVDRNSDGNDSYAYTEWLNEFIDFHHSSSCSDSSRHEC